MRSLHLLAPLLCLSLSSAAQDLPKVERYAGPPIRHLRLDARTGELSELDRARSGRSVCFVNSPGSGQFATPPAGTEWVDWSSGAAGGKRCVGTEIIQSVTVGYVTRARDTSAGGPGAAFNLALYRGTRGMGVLGGQRSRSVLTGLPGTTGAETQAGFLISVDFPVGDVCLPDGNIGWGFEGVDGLSGPFLVNVGVVSSGTVDLIDVYSPGPATAGNYSQTTSFATPDVASFWFDLDEGLGTDSPVTSFNGSGLNPAVLSAVTPPVLAQDWVLEIDTQGFPQATATVLALSIAPDSGTVFGFGELLIATPAINPVDVAVAGLPHVYELPKSVGLLGQSLYAQGIIFQPSGAQRLTLTNRLEFTFLHTP